ncbi:MAG: hypothetical protein VB092_03340 [Oscillospiraceae bacterium]|nr:hypothetical protein [Oscillospiraceae bacterium]
MSKKLLSCVLFVCCMLSGCASARELSQRVIVNALAVDKSGEEYVLTAGWLTSAQTQDVGFETGFFEGRGETLPDAAQALRDEAQRSLFFGHNATVVLGGTIRGDLDPVLRFLTASEDVRVNAAIYLFDGNAGELLRTKTDARSFGDAVEALRTQGAAQNDVEAQLYDIANGAFGAGAIGYLPVLERSPLETSAAQEETLHKLNCTSVVVVCGGRVASTLSEEQTQGLLLLENKAAQLRLETESCEAFLLEEPRCSLCVEGTAEAPRVVIRFFGQVRGIYKKDISVEAAEAAIKKILAAAYSGCVGCAGVDFFALSEIAENALDGRAAERLRADAAAMPARAEIYTEIHGS